MGISRILKRIAVTLGALGAASTAIGQAGFGSVDEARQYLAENPAGPRAAEAFRTIVNSDLAGRYPQYSPGDIARGQSRVVIPGRGLSEEQVERALQGVAGGRVAQRQQRRDDDNDGSQFDRSGGGGSGGGGNGDNGDNGPY